MEGKVKVIEVTPGTVSETGLFCIKDLRNKGFKHKEAWFKDQYEKGLRFLMLRKPEGKDIGFIEYTRGENAWRPVIADNYLFIHCLFIYPTKYTGHGYGSLLLKKCIDDASARKRSGVAVMTSEGPWMAGRDLFIENGFAEVSSKGRFKLLIKKLDRKAPDPFFTDWEGEQKKYAGWNLVYADQCPWHEKAVEVLRKTAVEYGILLKVHKIKTAEQAKEAPSGFGVFSLLFNGRLLEDHYISKTRFENILKKERGITA